MLRFERRFFPARRYPSPLRWVLWGAAVVLGIGLFLFLRAFVR
jgi:hypothetical protein